MTPGMPPGGLTPGGMTPGGVTPGGVTPGVMRLSRAPQDRGRGLAETL